MSKRDDFKEAMTIFYSGKRKEASKKLFALYQNTNDANLKLDVILALMSALNPATENDKLLQVANDGINISIQKNREDIKAYLMARKASYLSNEANLLQYRQKNLKLDPQWLGFATEGEQREYEQITHSIEKIEKDTDMLLNQSLDISQRLKNKDIEGHIWVSFGEVYSGRYIRYKMDALKGSSAKATWRLRLGFLRRHGLENYIFFNISQIKMLHMHISKFTEYFVMAARTFHETNDSAEAYAFHNLANCLRIAFKFRQAKIYLSQAKTVAQKHNDKVLLRQIIELDKIIKARNEDIPNYLEGETRDTF